VSIIPAECGPETQQSLSAESWKCPSWDAPYPTRLCKEEREKGPKKGEPAGKIIPKKS